MSGVLFWVQHLLGVGHLRRAELLAAGMAEAGLDVTVALGGPPVPEIPFRGARIAQLPPATVADRRFSAILDADGREVDDAWRESRRDALLRIFAETAPDVLLIELYPFGRRPFRFELVPLLEAAANAVSRPKIACSLRDILVGGKGRGRAEEVAETLRAQFDAVLVHGDPRLIPLDATFEAADAIADLVRYTGYVAAPAASAAAPAEGAGEVIVSAGGGAVGAGLLMAAAAARPLTALAESTWRFLTGPNLPEDDFARLAQVAGEGAVVERFRADFPERLRTCSLSISQAGYNTTMDILRAGAPAIVVPFETPTETEQRRRAELLAARGLVTVVPEADLSPATLAAGIAAALAAERPGRTAIDLSGAATTARLVAELSGQNAAEAENQPRGTCPGRAAMAGYLPTREGRDG
jgi:predicted glycosyltransferase